MKEDKMKRIGYTLHKDKQLLFADYSNSGPEEMNKAFAVLGEILKEADENSVLLLEDVSSVHFNRDCVNNRKLFLNQYKNKLKKAAMVGVEGLMIIAHETMQDELDIKLPAFKTLGDAKDWLVEDSADYPDKVKAKTTY